MTYELHLHIDTRELFADGVPFGKAGSYERIVGRAEVFLSPDSAHYQKVVDLAYAPQDERGRVRYETDVYLLKPVDMRRGNRRLFFDVVNRGDKRALQFFNDAAASNDPVSHADAGNGYLMRLGYSILWCGWQADVLPGAGRSTIAVPIARDGDRDITGTVREEIIVDEDSVVSIPLSGKAVTRSHPAISFATASASLSCRQCETDERIQVPETEWKFARLGAEGNPEASETDIYYPRGFRPGWIYEAIYTAKDPQLLGFGFAAVRDLVDMLRHDSTDGRGEANPLADESGQPLIEMAYAWGRSQSGRYLREFVYQGWNVGRSGRPIFNAVWPHVTGGGRLALNLRFGHPDRYPRQHEQHLYPSDQFPFAYVKSTDRSSGETDALLRHPETDPLVFHTQTASEYWQRRGSLVHADSRGEDLEEHPHVKMYLFASSQHHAAPGITPQSGPHQNPSNPLNTSPLLRALLVRLDEWATTGKPPPPSTVPRCDDGTLVDVSTVHDRFPKIADVRPPESPNRLFPQDYGSTYADGIAAEEPPRVDQTFEYAVRVPIVDADGNDIPGIRTPDVTVPRATYTGWNMRSESVGPNVMYSIVGSYLPFAGTEAERQKTGDERLSLAERYPSTADYVRQVSEAAHELHRRGLLLAEDVERYIAAAKNAD